MSSMLSDLRRITTVCRLKPDRRSTRYHTAETHPYLQATQRRLPQLQPGTMPACNGIDNGQTQAGSLPVAAVQALKRLQDALAVTSSDAGAVVVDFQYGTAGFGMHLEFQRAARRRVA